MGAAGTCLQRVNIDSLAKGKSYAVAINPSESYATTNFLEGDFAGVKGRTST